MEQLEIGVVDSIRILGGAVLHRHSPKRVHREVELLRSISFPPSAGAYLHANRGYLSKKLMGNYDSALAAYVIERVYWNDWLSFRYHQPDPKRVLEIGGGIGIFSLLLQRLANPERVTLIEKAEREADGQAFFLPNIFQELMQANSLDRARFVNVGESMPSETYSQICSFRALGFLFPYAWYRDLILERLEPGGTLLLDVRKPGFVEGEDLDIQKRFAEETPSELLQQLRRDFSNLATIDESSRSWRILASR